MRLINVETLELEEWIGEHIPPYAILSHTWDEGEVVFKDWQDHDKAQTKAGYAKISLACEQTRKDNLTYLWVDTCCIDKSSSAELSEAINSMFALYERSVVCYAHLADVSIDTVRSHSPVVSEAPESPSTGQGVQYRFECLEQSRWFTRGWTLQELLAPALVVFYSREWQRISQLKKVDSMEHMEDIKSMYRMQKDFTQTISRVTRVRERYLLVRSGITGASIAERMHWASQRKTTRIEDEAYCLLGLFRINMPLLYGEGPKAFIRLQEEIIKVSLDHSIFAWNWPPSGWRPDDDITMLAPSPRAFGLAGMTSSPRPGGIDEYHITNAGLSLKVSLLRTPYWAQLFAVLDCLDSTGRRLCIPLTKNRPMSLTNGRSGPFGFSRSPWPPFPLPTSSHALRFKQPVHELVLGRFGLDVDVMGNRHSRDDDCLRRHKGPFYAMSILISTSKHNLHGAQWHSSSKIVVCSECDMLIIDLSSEQPKHTINVAVRLKVATLTLCIHYEITRKTAAEVPSVSMDLYERNFGGDLFDSKTPFALHADVKPVMHTHSALRGTWTKYKGHEYIYRVDSKQGFKVDLGSCCATGLGFIIPTYIWTKS
ncbi:Uu.00g010830.m01.CDS01 [Anthostomella pinea]|uniref:Uu.00g010830.m01.CDS01 n=1 Tax=Anthostomella pinea TaxID=933095 RepID=A0AAI8YPZ3_9PEZI|nr:Uu.00g010830.m01.CDS01 [Anthostomella pinea]